MMNRLAVSGSRVSHLRVPTVGRFRPTLIRASTSWAGSARRAHPPVPIPPMMDECPSGGSHTRIPKQGGGGCVCAKCGSDC